VVTESVLYDQKLPDLSKIIAMFKLASRDAASAHRRSRQPPDSGRAGSLPVALHLGNNCAIFEATSLPSQMTSLPSKPSRHDAASVRFHDSNSLKVSIMFTVTRRRNGFRSNGPSSRPGTQRALSVVSAIVAVAMAQSASAADMPLAKAPIQAAPVFSWSGCYIGANGGAGRSRNDWGDLLGTIVAGDVHANGFLAGGQVGCDYQAGALVFGVEGLFDWSDLHGQTAVPPQGDPARVVSKLDRFATATGRIGYAFDRILPYVKGGFAWGHFNQEFDTAPPPGTAFVPVITGSQGVVGFVVGAGIEAAFLPNWSFKAEYDYIDFGTNGAQVSCLGSCGATPSGFPVQIRQNAQIVTFGLNYRFGAGILASRW
jgi:outer membrane immunogenic protein